MNDARRKSIDEALAQIEGGKGILESVRDEEQETYDNMPEAFQSGEKGEKAQAAIDALEEAINACDEIVSNLETAKE